MWSILTILTSLVLGLGLILYIMLYFFTGKNKKSYWTSRNVFQVDMDVIVPFWDRIRGKVPIKEIDYKMYQALKYQHGLRSYAGLVQLGQPLLVLLDLDLVKAITIKDFESFVDRRKMDMSKSEPIFHNMLLNKSGDDWKSLRSTLSPTFTTGKIKRMFNIFNESGLKMVQYIQTQQTSSASTEIEVYDVCSKLTVDVIASAAFGLDSQVFQNSNSPFATCAKKFQATFSGFKILKLMFLLAFPKILNIFRIPIIDREASEFFKQTVIKTIKHRKETGEVRQDFLQLLIEAQADELKADAKTTTKAGGDDELLDNFEKEAQLLSAKSSSKVQLLTDDIILSQALLFFSAGSDTTAILVVYAFYEMALNPEVQEKLYDEVNRAIENNNGQLDYDVLNQLNYLDMFVSEVLRKYPPGIRTERQCTAVTYKVPGSDLVLEKGQIVLMPTYAYHFDEEYFPNPNQFNPENFSAEAKAKRHPYAYQPFGLGPRNCIARRFALIEGKTAIAHLVHNFKIEPTSKTEIPPALTMSGGFRPKNGMWLNLINRK